MQEAPLNCGFGNIHREAQTWKVRRGQQAIAGHLSGGKQVINRGQEPLRINETQVKFRGVLLISLIYGANFLCLVYNSLVLPELIMRIQVCSVGIL